MLRVSDANKTAVQRETPWPVDFVEMVVDGDSPTGVQRLCNHFHNIDTVGSFESSTETFTAAGQLLGFGSISEDLEAKDNSLDISLSGIDQEVTSIVLGTAFEGSRIYVMRGYYDEDTGALVDVPYQRWAGRVNSFSIQDDYRFESGDKIIISIQCTSLLTTLLSREGGRYTNDTSFKYEDPDDVSMEYVASLVNFAPFFGRGAEPPPAPPPAPSGGGGGGKIVCTAMNTEYGFGSFRNAIWLNYAKENLTPYHEKGYHKLFGPWVGRMYIDTWWSPYLAKWGEGVARRRSADIFAVMRGKKKRSWLARIERAIMEPLCYIAGRWFSK
jgi:hypothetical protein